jgi:hypothetical protein
VLFVVHLPVPDDGGDFLRELGRFLLVTHILVFLARLFERIA